MSFYDAFKDAIDIAQKADNIDLYRKLLDLSRDALDLQNENYKLTEENVRLKKKLAEDQNIVRHSEASYITLKDEEPQIHYCAICWGSDHKLIQMVNGRCFVCEKKWLEAHK